MRNGKFTPGPWSSYIREMTGPYGETSRKCFIEKDCTALAQFENFGDEDEANAMLCAAAPEMYALLGRVEDYFKNRHIYGYGVEESVSAELLAKTKEVIKRIYGEKQKDSLHRR